MSDLNRERIIQALKDVQDASDFQIFGVLASSFQDAARSLQTYAKAFGYPEPPLPDPLLGPVYLKYNPTTALCYVDEYPGEHRGVLVSCQSEGDDRLNAMFGHLPLELYQA